MLYLIRKLAVMTIVLGCMPPIYSQNNLLVMKKWQAQEKGRTVDIQEDGSVACAIKTAGKENAGVRQTVVLNQKKTSPITFSAESKAENVSAGLASGTYGVSLDIQHQDGSSTFDISAPFKPGTHDWEKAGRTYMPDKPVKSISYYLHFRNRTGNVWFRNATFTDYTTSELRVATASRASLIPGAKRIPATVPDGFKELPYIENNPLPDFSPAESERGFMLFSRPITQPVYKNSIPLETERINSVSAFATLGEFEPLTFGVYPLRDVKNMKISISSLHSGEHIIPTENLDIRLVTEWPMRYPLYSSKDTFRRMPELLEPVTVNSFAKGECQRYWIKVKVPADAKAGLYTGEINITDDTVKSPVQLPVKFRVLGYALKSDPAKKYSVYYDMFSFLFYNENGKALDELMEKEFTEMLNYGINTFPTIHCEAKKGKSSDLEIYVKDPQAIDKMINLGFKGPIPMAGGIWEFYRKHVPGGKITGQWIISKLPENDEIYNEIERSFRKFRLECESKGWPELICCPMDEVASVNADFASKVYSAVRRAGIKTYITKDPASIDAGQYKANDAVDVWCSQPFSMPYEKVVADKRYHYWSYPNYVAGEIKDRVTQQKGGRMAYGFGLWRSGYQALIPWHWRWVTCRDDHFDYLRSAQSGSGNRLDEKGNFIPAIYFECFREGRDDYRYLYTLEQATIARENSDYPACMALVKESKALIQQIWDSIIPQEKYLSANMWADEEFNAVRWRIAVLTQKLLEFPATNNEIAPSVIADTKANVALQKDAFGELMKSGAFEKYDLGKDKFAKWLSLNKEAMTSVVNSSDLSPNHPILKVDFKVDYKVDGGGENGKYPIGWPRIRQEFGPKEVVLTDYDYFTFKVKIDSDRNEVDDDYTPIIVDIASYEGGSDGFRGNKILDLGDIQRAWLPVRISIQDLIKNSGRDINAWKHLKSTQFCIAENHYKDGTNIRFELDDIALLKVKYPVIENIECPSFVLLPAEHLTINVNGIGLNNPQISEGCLLKISIEAEDGKVIVSQIKPLLKGNNVALKLTGIQPGVYTLVATITNQANKELFRKTRSIEAINGFN